MGNINNIHKENGLQIDNLFSLGSGCLGFKFANLFNKRIKGPVDNISNPTSFRALYKIFNGSLFKKIINKEYDKIEQDEYKNNLYCYDGDFWVTHNNPLEDKYIIEFQNRVNNFNSFVKTINEYNNNYFLFAINYNDKTTLPNVELNILAGTKLQINFDTPLTSLEKFFSQDEDEHMNKVVSIDFSHFDSSALINMDSVFYGCSALKSLNLSTFQTTSVTTMSNLFYNCASLEVLDISNFNMAQTTNVQDMFFGINNLIFINLYNTQDDGKITSSSLNTDTEYLFYICQEK